MKHAAKEHHETELRAFQPAYEDVQQNNHSQFERDNSQRDTQLSPAGDGQHEERHVAGCREQGFKRQPVGSVQEPEMEAKERHGEAKGKSRRKLQSVRNREVS